MREKPYLETPNWRGWCRTSICASRAPARRERAGMKRCISPYMGNCLISMLRKAFSEQPLSRTATPISRAMMRLAHFDTKTRSPPSCRFLRQPTTMSCPAWISSTMRGMSSGSFCRSPSMVTMMSPRAFWMPAAIAAVWP
ncbi:hypothetical protein AL00_13825 [Sphingobium indicum F2]|uniref:Uncharacterized protein n=1 Tax=Sphingobium indicum F2 TaxID=1450518 RepID=A0A8E0WR09_9SPHN|nr:hypothetical protein AL00_13825 [Sphingobium indicum F2]